MEDAPRDTEDWTELGVPASAESNDLTAYSVLLVSEFEGDECGRPDRLIRGSGQVQTNRANVKGDVT